MTEREQPTDETQSTPASTAPDLAASGEQEERELSELDAAQPAPAPGGTPLSEPAPAVDHAATTPDRGDRSEDSGASALLDEHPEVLVGAAFAGGLALAVLLRLVGRG